MCRRIFKVSVGSDMEDMVSNSVRPIRTVQSNHLTDHASGRPTWSRSLSK